MLVQDKRLRPSGVDSSTCATVANADATSAIETKYFKYISAFVGYWLWFIGYRLSFIGYRLSVIGCRLSLESDSQLSTEN
jgi:hypothetical protein